MKKKISLSLLCALVINATASDLGTLQVESSTIDDKFEATQSEVSSTAVISGEEVEKLNPHSIMDILSGVPGVTLENVGTDSVKVHIRGVDNQMYMGEKPGVAIIIDGVPVQETSGKINVDLDNIESIKVIKGGASYLYGNDAIAGAIIITTKRAKGQSSSKVETEVGSFNSKRILATTNQSFENSALQLQGSNRVTDGYWDDAFVSVKSVNGKYQYYINDASDITFGGDYTKRETGDGNSVSGTLNAQTDPTSVYDKSYSGYYNTELIKGFITYSNNIDENSNFMLNLHKYVDDKTYKTSRTKTDKNEIWNQSGLKSEYRTAFDSLALMGGVDIQRNTTDELSYQASDGALTADYATGEDVNALYTEVKYLITNDLATTLNLRYDNIKHKYADNTGGASDVNPSYDVASYRLGFNYKLPQNHSLYASVSTGFRTPTVTQTSRNQESLKIDPTLDIPSEISVETTINYEIGVRGKVAALTYDASVYQLTRTNYIGAIAGNYITSNDPDESNYDNVGDMRSRGFELALSSNKNETVSFDLAYTYLDAIFTSYTLSQQLTDDGDRYTNDETFQRVDLSGNRVPRTSRHTLNLRVDYKPTQKITISPEITARSSYFADEVNANEQAGYGVVNLRAEYRFSESLEFFAKIENLLDKDYYQFVNINSSALATMEEDATIRVAPPAAYFAGLRYRF
ncbi:TonB-dependent receptor [bacterium]|nr:TonB-dependent receptor [bacterium]MBU1433799.1 TonB-dependent receptor [bacterium]MBU1503874.1 TonB-dependent receptor [bacterium]